MSSLLKVSFLLLGILLILLAVLTAISFAQHEKTISIIVKGQGAGYESGLGIKGEYLYRKDWYGIGINGLISNQKKNNADEGYTYSIGGHGRIYPIENFYLKAGYIFAGYSSTFALGISWEKSAWWPLVGLGYEFEYADVYATYYPKEHQTINEVEAFKIGTSINLYHGWGIMVEGSHQTYNQNGKRDSDQLITTGIIYRF